MSEWKYEPTHSVEPPVAKPAPPQKGRNLWKSGRSHKMRAGLVGLSSAAIVSVYAVGYVHTSADESPSLVAALETSAPLPTSALPTTTTRSSGSTAPQTTATPRAAATPTTTSGSTTAAALADGTYTGVGTSRHGSIEATVVVQGGKIVSAEVSTCGTRYPCSRISALPARVLAAQSTSVNYVSGATDSSVAYLTAVKAALQKAQA